MRSVANTQDRSQVAPSNTRTHAHEHTHNTYAHTLAHRARTSSTTCLMNEMTRCVPYLSSDGKLISSQKMTSHFPPRGVITCTSRACVSKIRRYHARQKEGEGESGEEEEWERKEEGERQCGYPIDCTTAIIIIRKPGWNANTPARSTGFLTGPAVVCRMSQCWSRVVTMRSGDVADEKFKQATSNSVIAFSVDMRVMDLPEPGGPHRMSGL